MLRQTHRTLRQVFRHRPARCRMLQMDHSQQRARLRPPILPMDRLPQALRLRPVAASLLGRWKQPLRSPTDYRSPGTLLSCPRLQGAL